MYTKASIKRWMRNCLVCGIGVCPVDQETGEVNTTLLVEQWDNECASGSDTLDPLHVAWDIAIEVANEYELTSRPSSLRPTAGMRLIEANVRNSLIALRRGY
jgi:hypothetical protein